MSCPTFVELMSECSPALEELALAAAREFRTVDEPATRAKLDRLGAQLRMAGLLDALDQGSCCCSLLGRRLGIGVTEEPLPATAMIDQVLDRRRGGELAVAVVFCEVGRRAGIPLGPVGSPGRYFVAHAETEVVLDVARCGQPMAVDDYPSDLRWICPHEVGYGLITELCRAFEASGDLSNALRAAELAQSLTVTGCYRAEVDSRAGQIRARLN